MTNCVLQSAMNCVPCFQKIDLSVRKKKLKQLRNEEYLYDEKDFRLNMLEDQMASEKLSEGITGFSKAIEELEDLLLSRFEEVCSDNLIKI